MNASHQHIRQLLGWLGDREHQLRLALEAAELGSWHWNLKTGETLWSERCRALLGVGPDAVASIQRFYQAVHPDDLPAVVRVIDEACRIGTTCSKDYRVVHADGSIRWLHSIGRVQRGRGPGGALVMSGIVRDVSAQHAADAAAQRRRDYLRQLLREAPVAAAKFDRELRFVAANQRFVEELRLGDRALAGRELLEAMPEAPAAWREQLRTSVDGQSLRTDPETLPRPDGSVDWIRKQALPWYDERGEIGGAVLLVEVLTRLRALEAQEQLWSNAFVHNIHGLAVSDATTLRYLAVNPAYGRLLGYAGGELVGRSVLDCYPESEHGTIRALSAQADALGASSGETLQRHRDGTLVPVLLDLVSLRDADGRVQYRISTLSDLRERKRAEAELRRRESQQLVDQRFRLLAESAPIGILLVDAAGAVTYANPAWLAMTGRAADEVLARDVLDIIAPDDRERVRRAWQEAATRDSTDLEFRYLRPDGVVRWVRSHASALRDAPSGALLGFVRTSVDITDSLAERAARERTHAQVRALAHRLEQLRALERAELADTLKKELYESLATLKDGLAALRAGTVAAAGADADPAHPAAVARLLGQAEAAQERLRRVVFDLRPPGIDELGFAPAIERYAAELGAQWSLRIDLDLPARPPAASVYVLSVVYDVAREALGNVARHARARRASLGVAVDAGNVVLRVSDDGCGIGEGDRHKPGCFGLLRAAERLAGLGGALRVLGVPGSGTVLQASVPLPRGASQGASAGNSGSDGRGSSA